jgi:tripartite-type tricarboxylate transporter receptor subunit TctC
VEKDIQPICIFAVCEVALVVHPSVPVNSLKDLIALAKSKPLAFASGGNGSPGHMIGEMFKRELGLELMTHIPYKGNAPASQSIVSGETQVFFGALPGTLQHIKAGKLKPLAVMANERSSFIPDVPTSKELGFPKLLAGNWFGVIAPAGTPREVVDRLQREIALITKEKDFIERIEKGGYKPFITTPEQMRATMRSDSAAWAAIVKSANIRPE